MPTSRESMLAVRQRRQHLDRRLSPARPRLAPLRSCTTATVTVG